MPWVGCNATLPSKVYRKLGVRSRTELAARWQPSNRR
jgi:DNA-binding CsgD family transcriptional regulator